MRWIQRLLCVLLMASLSPVQAQDLGDPGCDDLLLISGWRNNNVKIFDACSGDYIKDLDDAGRLLGPQTLLIGPDGMLYVVSERNNRVVRYKRDTLEYDAVVVGDKPETQEVETNPVPSPTGAIFDDQGRFYMASYTTSTVAEVDLTTGQKVRDLITAGASGLAGADIGLTIDSNQRLYVPGYDSQSVSRVGINQGAPEAFIVSGLSNPRTVLFTPSGELLVNNWRSGNIQRYDTSGNLLGVFTTDIFRPSGMVLDGNTLLVASDTTNYVRRFDLSNGSLMETVVDPRAGGLDGATGILLMEKTTTQPIMVNSFWTLGVGTISKDTANNEVVIDINEVIYTEGGQFGDDFDPDDITEKPWGEMQLVIDGCHTGEISYLPNAELASQFDAGSYAVERLAKQSPAGLLCEDVGFDVVEGFLWISGHWYGRILRQGEGFSIDVLNGDRAIVTWYTYLPASVQANTQ